MIDCFLNDDDLSDAEKLENQEFNEIALRAE